MTDTLDWLHRLMAWHKLWKVVNTINDEWLEFLQENGGVMWLGSPFIGAEDISLANHENCLNVLLKLLSPPGWILYNSRWGIIEHEPKCVKSIPSSNALPAVQGVTVVGVNARELRGGCVFFLPIWRWVSGWGCYSLQRLTGFLHYLLFVFGIFLWSGPHPQLVQLLP